MNFCVKCGKETENIIDGLCTECFLDGKKLISLPHHVNVFVCTNCGDTGTGEFWETKDLRDAILDAAEGALNINKEAKKLDIESVSLEQDPYTFVVEVTAKLDVKGCPAEDSATTIIRLKNTVCKRCSRQLGNYYEAILQIRGSKEVPHKTMKEALRKVENLVDAQSITNRRLFITKAEEVQGGIDIYLSSISMGKAASKELTDTYCAETKEASKLVGLTEEGTEMYRVTYLVRLPDFQAGDIVQFEGRYFKLVRLSSTGAKVIDITNHRERSVKRSDIPMLKVFVKAGDLREAVVISKGKGEVQILEPSNYSTVDLKIPEDAEIGDAVKVVEINDSLYYVP
ncbi:NMD3 family protein [Candidatus Methanoplasma termitum]|uniref:NMD3 family protein n=1 Tax=Candidatus Methanoplasma termitum TaxID=1577791 RepID=A0A0A7LDY7_9ARCH|nr:NMD3-related protein [Candidatus Methanoplasma termitum]AIZ57289.1 NMD3 family protein [Candidatus Methanoplasma termitum]MCL2334068.1 NMD3-related protein [Candidatus Methanoplasma sp.]